jgi:two-component system cell cycle response regulator DivK
MVGDRERVLAAGATGYIEKPINPETFVSEIIQYLPGDKNIKGKKEK